MADGVVIGVGHNGLVAANLLADAGWQVQVLEATVVAHSHADAAVQCCRATWPRRPPP
jgi:choline dehydrogenase-like flavoprotein